jgi:hypothetical protein
VKIHGKMKKIIEKLKFAMLSSKNLEFIEELIENYQK